MRNKEAIIEKLKNLVNDPRAPESERIAAKAAIDRILNKKEPPRKEGTIRIKFPKSKCTDKQYQYISVICRYFRFEYPDRDMSFEEASAFLNKWGDLYREVWDYGHR